MNKLNHLHFTILWLVSLAVLSGCVASNPPLHSAVISGSTDSVSSLIKSKEDVNGIDSDGYTPLWWAVAYLSYDKAEILLKNNADQNLLTPSPVICYAATSDPKNKGYLRMIKLLVKYNANLNDPICRSGRDTVLESAEFMAKHYKNYDIVKYLISQGATYGD